MIGPQSVPIGPHPERRCPEPQYQPTVPRSRLTASNVRPSIEKARATLGRFLRGLQRSWNLSTENTLAQAIVYARDRQWQIFPVNSGLKEPLIKGWPTEATTDIATIEGWWGRWPDAGIGIATGPRSQLCVIDCDSEKAYEAIQVIDYIPDTLTAITARGIHLYFRTLTALKSSAGVLATKVDVRCNGGFVVAPPSIHASGHEYAWRNPSTPVATLPDWLEGRIAFPPAKKRTFPKHRPDVPANYAESIANEKLALLRCAPDGLKHSALLGVSMRIAGLVKVGWSDERTQTEAMLKALLENETPPKDLENARRTIASAFQKATKERLPDKFLTERELAARFVEECKDFRYFPDKKAWMRFQEPGWDWSPDPCLAVGDMAQTLIDAGPTDPDADPQQHARSLRRFQNYRGMMAIVAIARRNPAICISLTDMNRDPYLFNCKNGTVDLRTGKLRPHDPADLMTLVSPYAYNPEAKHEQWSEALAMYTGHDQDLMNYLQRMFGSCLVREVTDEKSWILRGDGANGKTALLEAITRVMGPYAKPTTTSSLITRINEQHTSAIGTLVGAGLAYMEELEKDATLDMDKIKRYFGRTPTRVQLTMGGEFVDITPTWKLVLSSNHDPRFPDASYGAKRRFVVVPFDQKLKKEDLHFIPKLLKAEAEGILKWLVDGALEYITNGLGTCKAVELRTAQFHADQDPLTDFLDECCMVEPSLFTSFRVLYAAYADHCKEWHERPLSTKAFGALLTRKGFPVTRSGHDRQKGRAGLALKKDLANQYASRMMSS